MSKSWVEGLFGFRKQTTYFEFLLFSYFKNYSVHWTRVRWHFWPNKFHEFEENVNDTHPCTLDTDGEVEQIHVRVKQLY